RILRTRASHSNEQIGDPGLWQRIWKEQLGLENEEQFWEALRTGERVHRVTGGQSPPEGPSIPAWVVQGLIRAGVPEAEIRELDAESAPRRLEELWSEPR
ncbi:MAG: hypothetical protein ACRDO9_12205, partial [Gaiellales bacterium]